MIPHTRTVLAPAATHQHYTMLLHIMAFARNIRRYNSPCAQPHTRRLPLSRIRLLGFRDANFQANTFKGRGEDGTQSGRDGLSRFLRLAAAL